jgi:hypothetical protein
MDPWKKQPGSEILCSQPFSWPVLLGLSFLSAFLY